MEQYWIWLSSVNGIGIKRFYQLLAYFGDARTIWDNIMDEKPDFLPDKAYASLRDARSEAYFYRLFDSLERKEVQCLTGISDLYPDFLLHTQDAPPVLYVLGEADFMTERMIGVVGTRRATRDGLRASYDLSKGLAEHGVAIVSGLARGIDTNAHTGCLDALGRTIAVLGSGCDVVYPPENKKLYDRILANGGTILSEQLPGSSPLAQHFPARNRIISALSEGILLVEAGKSSGGLITADYAAEQGKELFVVPGSIYSASCEGSNALPRDCNAPVLSEWDILEYYRWEERTAQKKSRTVHEPLSEEEEKIVDPLRVQEMSFDEIAAATGYDASRLNTLLTMLELRGIVLRAPGRMYRLA